MRTVLFTAVISLLAIGAAGQLLPPLRSARWRVALGFIALLSLAGWIIPIAMGRGVHGTAPVVGSELKEISSVWIVTAFLTIIGVFLLLIARAVAYPVRFVRRPAVPDPANPSRRTFLTHVGTAVPLVAAAGGVGGVISGNLPFRLRRETIRISNLPPALDGFRIGQLTDVHVGAFISPADVRRAVELLNAEGVDMQAMTGDLIDDLDSLEETFDAIGGSTARHGMFAIYGNHEHWRGIGAISRKYRQLAENKKPVRLLVDESTRIEHDGAAIRIVGVDYPMGPLAGREKAMGDSARVAFAGCKPDETVICLAHTPAFFPHASSNGARLTLSGHTHGGQVALLGIPVFSFLVKYILGKYRDGENHLFVSGGTGHWMPFRIGVPAEVTVLTLKAA